MMQILNLLDVQPISLIGKKTFLNKNVSDRRNNGLRMQLNCLKDRLNDSIEASKQKDYCRMTNKLSNTEKSSKTYWSKAS